MKKDNNLNATTNTKQNEQEDPAKMTEMQPMDQFTNIVYETVDSMRDDNNNES